MYILFSLLLLTFFNFSAQLFQWEERVLKCENFDCVLLKSGQSDEFSKTECRNESSRHICDIQCDGADRDSVISKKPTDFRSCTRFYTYNTQKSPSGKWYIWRDSKCAQSNITLSVHCAFPFPSL